MFSTEGSLTLKEGKARVVKRTPFVIKLLHGSTGYKQPVVLGVDAGSRHIGLSACTESRELYKEELAPRNDVVELLSARRQYRLSRRNRKPDTERRVLITEYTASTKDGWHRR